MESLIKTFQKVCAWWEREDVRTMLTVTVLAGSIATYGLIFYIGRRPEPMPPPGVPLFWRLHPERLLACGASLLGMFTVCQRLRHGQPLLEPLAWIFLATLVHLCSLAIQFHWI